MGAHQPEIAAYGPVNLNQFLPSECFSRVCVGGGGGGGGGGWDEAMLAWPLLCCHRV